MNSSPESFVSKYVSKMALEIRPLELVVGQSPAACFAETPAARRAIAATPNQAGEQRAFAVGSVHERPAVKVAPLGDLSAQELIAAISAI
ncbi:hypothetical protein ABJI51_34555 [Amycolatopsis sp. NEAU-NG30]|uniref:Uncharacterized protein n=1 Tax=Amycolatopsis melonis TaxID=3156488 RepID=A0ABV0LPK1_9PSEU